MSYDSDPDTGTIVVVLFMIAFAFAMGCFIGHAGTDNAWKDEAAKEGHAEYYLDEDNSRHWRWLDKPKAEGQP